MGEHYPISLGEGGGAANNVHTAGNLELCRKSRNKDMSGRLQENLHNLFKTYARTWNRRRET